MESINEIIKTFEADNGVITLRDCQEESFKTVNLDYLEYLSKRKKPPVARFKMQVHFIKALNPETGPKHYFFSYDWQKGEGGQRPHDEFRGFRALHDQYLQWMHLIKTCTIYVNLEDQRARTEEHGYNSIAFRNWIDKNGEFRALDIPPLPFVEGQRILDLPKSRVIIEALKDSGHNSIAVQNPSLFN